VIEPSTVNTAENLRKSSKHKKLPRSSQVGCRLLMRLDWNRMTRPEVNDKTVPCDGVVLEKDLAEP
jgi:hypothetical protein